MSEQSPGLPVLWSPIFSPLKNQEKLLPLKNQEKPKPKNGYKYNPHNTVARDHVTGGAAY